MMARIPVPSPSCSARGDLAERVDEELRRLADDRRRCRRFPLIFEGVFLIEPAKVSFARPILKSCTRGTDGAAETADRRFTDVELSGEFDDRDVNDAIGVLQNVISDLLLRLPENPIAFNDPSVAFPEIERRLLFDWSSSNRAAVFKIRAVEKIFHRYSSSPVLICQDPSSPVLLSKPVARRTIAWFLHLLKKLPVPCFRNFVPFHRSLSVRGCFPPPVNPFSRPLSLLVKVCSTQGPSDVRWNNRLPKALSSRIPDRKFIAAPCPSIKRVTPGQSIIRNENILF